MSSAIGEPERNSDDSWMGQAACRTEPAQWFTDPDGPQDISDAVTTCNRCPVKAPCLATALELPAEVDIGIWGGTTERDRKLIRQGRTPPARLPAPKPEPQPAPPRKTRVDRTTVRRLPEPELTVARDAHGDFTDLSGRVLIFSLPADPPWMLMVDERPIARTDTFAEARQAAWTALNAPARSSKDLATPAADVRQADPCHKSRPTVRTPSATDPIARGRSR